MRAAFSIVAAAVMLAGCAASTSVGGDPAPSAVRATPVATTASDDARACVSLANIRESKVIDDRTIDFHLRDGRVLRSALPYACPSLGFERAFSYSTSLSQLCSTDIITVIVQGGGPRQGASCGLGKFTPITAEAAAR